MKQIWAVTVQIIIYITFFFFYPFSFVGDDNKKCVTVVFLLLGLLQPWLCASHMRVCQRWLLFTFNDISDLFLVEQIKKDEQDFTFRLVYAS